MRRALRTSGPRASAMLVGNARRVSGGASSPPETLAPTVSRATSSAPRDGTGSHAPRVRARGPCSPPAPGSGAEPAPDSASSPPASASSPSASANRRGSPPGELSARAKRELEAEVALLRARINDSASAKEASERMHEHLARRAERAARVAAKKHGRLALPPEFEVGGGEAEPGVREAARIAQRAGVRRPAPGTTAAIAADDARARDERKTVRRRKRKRPPRDRGRNRTTETRASGSAQLGGRPPRARANDVRGGRASASSEPASPRAAKPRTRARASGRRASSRAAGSRPEHRPLMDWFEERGVGREGRRLGDDKDATLRRGASRGPPFPAPKEGDGARRSRRAAADDSDSAAGPSRSGDLRRVEPVGGPPSPFGGADARRGRGIFRRFSGSSGATVVFAVEHLPRGVGVSRSVRARPPSVGRRRRFIRGLGGRRRRLPSPRRRPPPRRTSAASSPAAGSRGRAPRRSRAPGRRRSAPTRGDPARVWIFSRRAARRRSATRSGRTTKPSPSPSRGRTASPTFSATRRTCRSGTGSTPRGSRTSPPRASRTRRTMTRASSPRRRGRRRRLPLARGGTTLSSAQPRSRRRRGRRDSPRGGVRDGDADPGVRPGTRGARGAASGRERDEGRARGGGGDRRRRGRGRTEATPTPTPRADETGARAIAARV